MNTRPPKGAKHIDFVTRVAEGHEARLSGKELSDNPFVAQGQKWKAWRIGWNQADVQSRRFKEDW